MKLKIKVKAHAKQNKIETKEGNEWTIRIKAPAIENKANEELISFLAEELNIRAAQIKIVSGHTSKIKIIEIIEIMSFPRRRESRNKV